MNIRLVGGILLVLGLAACRAQEKVDVSIDLAGLEDIRINYQYMGWSSVEEHFTITPATSQEGFILRAQYETKSGTSMEVETPLSSDAVQAFLQELDAPGWPRVRGVRALAQKIDRAGLRKAEPPNTIPPSRCTRSELKRLAAIHIKQEGVAGLVDDRYGRGIGWTDDYPFALVQVRWRDRPDFVMSSRSQKAMMLPWDIGAPSDSPPESGENWSLPISTSLRSLLPPASRLHERLDGMLRLQDMLESGVMTAADRRCDAMTPRQ